jgi:hypothetical protein
MRAWLHPIRYVAVACMGMAAGATDDPLWYIAVGCMTLAGVLHGIADWGKSR